MTNSCINCKHIWEIKSGWDKGKYKCERLVCTDKHIRRESECRTHICNKWEEDYLSKLGYREVK